MSRKRIYVASPYTKPDPCENTNKAITAGNVLWAMGYAPFIPHLSHFWHTVTPKPYAEWLEMDLEWLEVCHAVLRLAGESSGVDGEVARARELGIPVYFDVGTLRHELPV